LSVQTRMMMMMMAGVCLKTTLGLSFLAAMVGREVVAGLKVPKTLKTTYWMTSLMTWKQRKVLRVQSQLNDQRQQMSLYGQLVVEL
jgi:hypothetical protein